MRAYKLTATRVIKFNKGTGFESYGWHIPNSGTGDDRTLCGLAWEGEGNRSYQPFSAYSVAKIGKPTCEHCLGIIKVVADVLEPSETKQCSGGHLLIDPDEIQKTKQSRARLARGGLKSPE